MQLFITDNYTKKQDQIIINEKRIIDQLRKVLRAKHWYTFYMQNKSWETTIRYKLEIIEVKQNIISQILDIEEKNKTKSNKWVITAILNKFDKMELIVQKLTEIGINKIYFVSMERSVFKDIKDKKLERFFKIALEATEQSWGWDLPEIKVFKQISEINWKKAILNFDGINYKKSNLENINFIVIGPEWWLTEKDINSINPELSISLWDKILRAETASILWWFILK